MTRTHPKTPQRDHIRDLLAKYQDEVVYQVHRLVEVFESPWGVQRGLLLEHTPGQSPLFQNKMLQKDFPFDQEPRECLAQ